MITRSRLAPALWLLLAGCLLGVVVPITAGAASAISTHETIPPTGPYADWAWSTWTTDHTAIHDAGEAFWIGGPNSVYRWNKTDLTTSLPVMGIDGLPLARVEAITSVPDDTVWLAGKEGIVSISDEGRWRYFPAPTDLRFTTVAAVAATTDGDVWLTDALPGGRILHFSVETEQWRQFDDAFAAAEAYRDTLLGGGLGANRIWAVHEMRIWHGFNAYDGSSWQNLGPPDDWSPYPAMLVDDNGSLWATGYQIWRWDAGAWTLVETDGTVSTGGQVWQIRSTPVSPSIGFYTYAVCATDCYDGDIHISDRLADAAFIPTDEALWFFDDSGLMQIELADPPVYTPRPLPHSYFYGLLGAYPEGHVAIMRWVWAERGSTAEHVWVNRHDDQGTSRLDDDEIRQVAAHSRPEAIAMTGSGNVWSVSRDVHYPPYTYLTTPPKVTGEQTSVAFPDWPATDQVNVSGLFLQGEDRVVFDTSEGLIVLDTRGSLEDFGDDRWSVVDPPGGIQAADAEAAENVNLWRRSRAILDEDGGLWYRDGCTVYYREGGEWQPRFHHCGLVDLIPSINDRVFAISVVEGKPYVHVIWPQGYMEMKSIADLLAQDRALVQSIRHSNLLWTVAPDGAVWYIEYPLENSETSDPHIVRDTGTAQWSIALPVDGVDALAVDRYGHLWLTRNRNLWRFSPRLSLDLTVSPPDALLFAGEATRSTIQVTSDSGAVESAEITVGEIPPELQSDIDPQFSLPVSRTVALTLATTGETPPGFYQVSLAAASGLLTDDTTVTVRVVEQIEQVHLPYITRR